MGIVPNKLFYGDNLDNLRNLRDETVDLCYIDPPFNSKKNYNQIYKNLGGADLAQAQAFTDIWSWDDQAEEEFRAIIGNEKGQFAPQTVALIKGLHQVLTAGSLLAYLVSMTHRLHAIHRTLKPTGTFYLHCDPTSSHYLKLVLDGIFCSGSEGGDFLNEIIWCYAGGGIPKQDFPRKHDVILRYAKSRDYYYQPTYRPYSAGTLQRGRTQIKGKYFEEGLRQEGTPINDWWTDVPKITSPTDPEKLGYPTQKPEALLERIIRTSSIEGDVVLDAYCGCGTTVAVAQRLKRQWIGMDITYQSIALVLFRLEKAFGADVANAVSLGGVPKDMESATALANKKEDRSRKEFEKWAVLTYTMNRARPNNKKGADAGIDGIADFLISSTDSGKMVFQVKSGHVGRGDIAKLKGDMDRENAVLATFITLQKPTAPMRSEAKAAGKYVHELTGRHYDKIRIVTIQEMLEDGKRLDLPLIVDALKKGPQREAAEQLELLEVG